MKTSESIQSLAAALVLFNSECPEVVFDKENKFLGNKYATLGAILKAIRPTLAKHGLTVVQGLTSDGLTTRVLHLSGEWIESTAPMIQPGEEKGKSAAQVYGSIITYMRRYMVTAALGIVSDDDNDGMQQGKKTGQDVKSAASELTTLKKQVRDAFAKYTADDRNDVSKQLNDNLNNPDVKFWKDHLAKLTAK